MQKKLNILILTYDFPPYISVGGLRPNSWFKELHHHGIHPIVVTRQWRENYLDNKVEYISKTEGDSCIIEEHEFGTIVKSPYTPNLSNRIFLRFGENRFSKTRRVLSGLIELIQYFLPVSPKKEILNCALAYVKKNNVDVVIATGEPFVLFHFAKKISRQKNIPWIADYRDPWSNNIYLNNKPILKSIFKYIEQKTVRDANCITTVDEALKTIIHAQNHSTISIIRNGFESKLLELHHDTLDNSTFHIAFSGTLYPWHPIEQVARVVGELTQELEKKIVLHLYGINNQSTFDLNQEHPYPLLSIQEHPKMENFELAKELVKSHAFLLFNDYSYIGTKIYDYLALRKPIVFCFLNDTDAYHLKQQHFHTALPDCNILPQVELLRLTKSGIITENQQSLKQELKQLVLNYTESIEGLSFEGIEQFSRTNQTAQLAQLVHELVLKYEDRHC